LDYKGVLPMSDHLRVAEEILCDKVSAPRDIVVRVDEVHVHPSQTKKEGYIRGCLLVVQYDSDLYVVWLPYSLLVEINHNLCNYFKGGGFSSCFYLPFL